MIIPSIENHRWRLISEGQRFSGGGSEDVAPFFLVLFFRGYFFLLRIREGNHVENERERGRDIKR